MRLGARKDWFSIFGANFEAGRLDGLDFPTFVEGGDQLVLCDAPRPGYARRLLAEAKQIMVSCALQNHLNSTHVPHAVFVGKHVKQAAVDNIVELLGPILQVQRIFDQESGGESTIGRFLLG